MEPHRPAWSRAVMALAFVIALSLFPRPASAREPGTVDLDLVGADVRNVVRLLADVGHVNVVIGDEVSGQVTLRLKGVRWQRALEVVLGAKGLVAERDGNVIRVGSAAAFAKERAARIDAHAACVQTAPLRTRVIRISYADPSELAKMIQPTLTKRGSVAVDERTGSLLVTDVVGCD
jgi:type II secretory pathway component HofQ